MVQHSVLIGNGINIQFSDNKEEYKNRSIILRALNNMKSGKYTEAFDNIVDPDLMYNGIVDLVDWRNDFLYKGLNFQKAINSDDEFDSFFNTLFRYKNKKLKPEDIIMEDYFLLYDLFNNYFIKKHKDSQKIDIKYIYFALLLIFTDAIYNDGKIELIYQNMSTFVNEIDKFDNIFTINYDNNLDKITNKPVYHLHGDFNTLQDRFIPSTVLGYINSHSNRPVAYLENLKHAYSNTVMGFSGSEKVKYINYFNEASMALNIFIERLRNPNDTEIHSEYERLKKSTKEIDKYALLMIETKLSHPELTYTEYPLTKFSDIEGWLSIIGMSPNNDNHLIEQINNNKKLTKVIYYYKQDEERDWMFAHISKERHLLCKKVDDYWKSIGC